MIIWIPFLFSCDDTTNKDNEEWIQKKLRELKKFQIPTITGVQKTWESITRNYELIEGAQLSNGFIILMTLHNTKETLSSSDISKTMSYNSLGRIYKPTSTLKDSMENRLKREGYVEGIVENNKTYYKITSKGKKLLKGWISFLSAYKEN